MSENKNVYQRLATVKQEIVEMELTKEGKNSAISRKTQDKNGRTISVAYSYFTLESIIPVVTNLCTKNGLATNFLLLEDSFGLYGLLSIVNIDNPAEKIEIIHRTGISSENKMMNKTQQYGSVSTYSHRYLLQHTFGIVDNELDPDNEKFYKKDNQESYSNSKSEPPKPAQEVKKITSEQVKEFWDTVKECEIGDERVANLLRIIKVDAVNNIPEIQFKGIVASMKKDKEKRDAELATSK